MVREKNFGFYQTRQFTLYKKKRRRYSSDSIKGNHLPEQTKVNTCRNVAVPFNNKECLLKRKVYKKCGCCFIFFLGVLSYESDQID